ncbi:hypothetical protein [Flavobacterium sharifuzzamanii]|uniref:hypothetical protein n=1 Tax=Flavobacterium sharifuzzamanii TaxID=2211133 RepID=UPI000DABADC0|nr:hypothetical protein [Flavobacterium sharifuzzamanii]KAF2080300.1 hypothetical protein DMA14_13445 [Flavobacterium sharifuzzamanii]
MKNLKAPFLVIALLLLNVSLVTANEQLPEPGNASKTAEDPCFGCPEQFPINQNISFLLIGGLALGAVAIYKNKIKKASI